MPLSGRPLRSPARCTTSSRTCTRGLDGPSIAFYRVRGSGSGARCAAYGHGRNLKNVCPRSRGLAWRLVLERGCRDPARARPPHLHANPDVVLVGHSFGGTSISGVADRLRDRIRRLVYLDAVILENGQSVFSQLPKDVVAARTQAARETSDGFSIPAPPAAAFGINDAAQTTSVASRLTPHPFLHIRVASQNCQQARQRPAGELHHLYRSDLSAAGEEPQLGQDIGVGGNGDQDRP